MYNINTRGVMNPFFAGIGTRIGIDCGLDEIRILKSIPVGVVTIRFFQELEWESKISDK